MFKAGDWIECLEDYNPGNEFTKGKVYWVARDVQVNNPAPDRSRVLVEEDDSGVPNSWSVSKFRIFISPATISYSPGTSLPTGAAVAAQDQGYCGGSYYIDQLADLMRDAQTVGEVDTDVLTEQRKKEGLCPECGEKGHFSHFALVCSIHGEY